MNRTYTVKAYEADYNRHISKVDNVEGMRFIMNMEQGEVKLWPINERVVERFAMMFSIINGEPEFLKLYVIDEATEKSWVLLLVSPRFSGVSLKVDPGKSFFKYNDAGDYISLEHYMADIHIWGDGQHDRT